MLQGNSRQQMSSLVIDLGPPPPSSCNGYLQGRKQAKALAMAKDRDRSCFRLQRLIIGRRIGTLIACLISALSLLMLLNATSRFSSPSSSIPVTDNKLSSDMVFGEQRHNLSSEDVWVSWPPPAATRVERMKRHIISPVQTAENQQLIGWPLLSSDHPLPVDHPCHSFTLPPPPADKKRTGPRPCPVCYLPVEKTIQEMPKPRSLESSAIKELVYAEEPPIFSPGDKLMGRQFGGHPSLEDRVRSYQIREQMKIHCGFAQGAKPGSGSGFDIDVADRKEMDKCTGIVVASAIFGNYDQLQQPINISDQSRRSICFFMFVDEETWGNLDVHEIDNGVWKVVVVHNLPYKDARRNGKIPKLLLHRLFPNARFSLWIDGKLKLVVDPYQILERFLWRRNFSFAISRHYKRFDVFEEAEANKAAGKYNNASIDFQVDFYKSEGLVPYNSAESLFPSDVPEGCVIIREHTPITNLFTCLWFNEVDRFTSRDQLSFAVVRDYLMGRVPFRLSMFLDCERRNFVVQEYHRDLLEQRNAALQSPPTTVSGTQQTPPHPELPPPPPSVISRNVPNTVRGSPSRSHGGRHRRGASRRRGGSRGSGRSA